MSSAVRVLLCNAPASEAQRIAEALVTERLAACVNLVPVQSVYVWKGELQRDAEVTLLIKTTAEGVDALRARLVELHSYELPEVLSLAVVDAECHLPYLAWVRDSVRSLGDDP